MKRLALLFACAAACKSAPAPAPTAAAPSAETRGNAAVLVAEPDRDAADRKLDPGRKPVEMLQFLGVQPGMKVEDMGAGGGYTTELLARAVAPSGVVYMQNDPRWLPFLKDAIARRLTHPAMKNAIRADVPFDDPIPSGVGGLDLVVLNVIYHDIANMPVDRVRMNQIVFNALKPGGAFVVIDSSAKPGSGLSATQPLHRIDEDVVKQEVEKAGFKLAQEGDFLRNPDDARDWNSSPQAAEKAGKRGQSDRFALKFVRPEGSKAQIVPPHLRLPEGVEPIRVTAELTVDPGKDSFEGTEEIELKLDEPAHLLWLNADSLEISGTQPSSTVIPAPPSFVGLRFAEPLAPGNATVRIRWTGKLSATDNEGAYRQQENGAWYVLTQGEPLGMRRVFPSFDEPLYKIPWRISLRVPKADAAYFNTPVEATEDAGEMKLVRFAETKPLPSYLLAFGVGPFERVDAGKTKSGAPVGIVVTRGKTAWAKYSAQSSPRIMDILEDWFEIPYHYPKLDLIEVPLGGGAMENPGLITFAQRINLARPGEETPQFHRRAADVEAHEFSHLWFGDMVTTEWWDDLWLNEAFATWMTFHAIEKFAPSWNTPAERADSMLRAMNADRLLSARRIRQPIQSEGDIKTAFDGITYQKGAAVIRMFEEYVGEDVFRRGVQSYLKEFADEGATARHFLGSISAAAGKNVSPSFSTFLDQAGLPLVTARLSCEGGKGTLSLEQSRYLPLGAAQTPPPEQTWQIPVCARTDQGRACTLLAQKSGTLDLGSCPRWVMPNAGASGYYRTALDDEQLGKLTQNTATLTSPEKMLFFSDVFAASQAGAVEFPRAFELARSLAADKDRHVVQGLFPAVEYPDARGFVSDGLRPKYAAWVRDTFGRRARALGFAERKGEGDDARILRPPLLELVGDQGEDPALRAQARKVADRWLADHRTTSPELASAALFLSAIAGDQAFYEKLHAAAKKEPVRVERQRILQAMGEFRDPKLVQQGLQIALSDEFDPRESILLMWGAASDPRTREAALQFVEENFDKIVKRMPRDYGAGLVNAGSGFCDDAHAQALDKFFRPRSRLYPGGDRRFAQALEQVRQCAAFRARAEPALTAWLEKRSPQALRSR
ncbi:MAG TPA: M1 family aminopeptidase [Myxococcales bacterium]|nr:M1 family aminopeptidase [Myxococcales bacterium]